MNKHPFELGRRNVFSALHILSLLGVILLLLGTFSTKVVKFDTLARLESMLSTVLPGTIVDLTNTERGKDAAPTLKRSPILDEAAYLKALHMRDNDYFEHYSPDGISPWHWFDTVGYDYVHAGENLAVFFKESEAVVEAWMNSPLHKENILKKEYSEIGVAVVDAEHRGYKTVFVVQLFGTPAREQTGQQEVLEPTHEQSADVHVLSQASAHEHEQRVFGVLDESAPVEGVPPETGNGVLTDREEVIGERIFDEPNAPRAAIELTTIDDTRVYLSGHLATGTPILSAREKDAGQQGLFNVLYFFLSLLVMCVIVFSILHAKIKNNIRQACYGTALLVLLLAVVTLNTILTGASG